MPWTKRHHPLHRLWLYRRIIPLFKVRVRWDSYVWHGPYYGRVLPSSVFLIVIVNPSCLTGCRNVEEFQCLNRIEEGTFGVVYRALDKKFDEIVALKRLKMEKEKEGFPITSLREINTLLKVGIKGGACTVRDVFDMMIHRAI